MGVERNRKKRAAQNAQENLEFGGADHLLLSEFSFPSQAPTQQPSIVSFQEIISYESQALTNAGKSQLDIYLEEPKYGFADHENLNVLEFWKTHQQRFSSLALMAADVLAILITTVASESAFSIGSRVLTNYRSCMLPSKVQDLICTRNWLHNFPCDFEEESLLIKKTVLESSSNVLEPIDVDEDEDSQEEQEDDQEIFNLLD